MVYKEIAGPVLGATLLFLLLFFYCSPLWKNVCPRIEENSPEESTDSIATDFSQFFGSIRQTAYSLIQRNTPMISGATEDIETGEIKNLNENNSASQKRLTTSENEVSPNSPPKTSNVEDKRTSDTSYSKVEVEYETERDRLILQREKT